MKRLLFSVLLLLLVSCSSNLPGTEQEATFVFSVDPDTETVTVTSLGSSGLRGQAVTGSEPQVLVPDTDLKLVSSTLVRKNGGYIIKAKFQNVTTCDFSQPFTFTKTTTKNVISSTEPTVSNADLGGDGVLSPNEMTRVLKFHVVPSKSPFTYIVTAKAIITCGEENEVPVVNITDPEDGDTVSSNVGVFGTATDDNAVTQLTYQLNGGFPVDVSASLSGDNFVFSISSANLATGNNTLTVLATDAAGLTGSDIVTFIFDPGLPPEAGQDVVVFNDVNVFVDDALADPNNVLLLQNLVDFPGTGGPRDAARTVYIDCGRAAAYDLCNTFDFSLFRSTMEGEGYTVTDIASDSDGTLNPIASSVRVIFLGLPRVGYTVGEINALKRFAAEGGRIVFVGEWDGFYGETGLAVENEFLRSMGAQMENVAGAYDCGYTVIPAESLRANQITNGLTQVTIACSSEVILGPNDFALYYDTTNTRVLSAVAKIDFTPIASLAARSAPTMPRVASLSRPLRLTPSGE